MLFYPGNAGLQGSDVLGQEVKVALELFPKQVNQRLLGQVEEGGGHAEGNHVTAALEAQPRLGDLRDRHGQRAVVAGGRRFHVLRVVEQ